MGKRCEPRPWYKVRNCACACSLLAGQTQSKWRCLIGVVDRRMRVSLRRFHSFQFKLSRTYVVVVSSPRIYSILVRTVFGRSGQIRESLYEGYHIVYAAAVTTKEWKYWLGHILLLWSWFNLNIVQDSIPTACFTLHSIYILYSPDSKRNPGHFVVVAVNADAAA